MIQEPMAVPIEEPMFVLVEDPMAVLAVLLVVLAGLFAVAAHPLGQRFFRIVPLLVFAYFVPTSLSNTGIIPQESPIYDVIRTWFLPASLILLTMAVDVPAILRLGRKVLILFLVGTLTIVLGGPLAYLTLGWMVPAEMGEQGWKGLAALSGSWIGGAANFVAIGESVGATKSTMAMIVVIDVALANVWMAVLLFFSGHDEKMDAAIGADRGSLDELKDKVESFQNQVATVTTLRHLLWIVLIAVGGTALASHLAGFFPEKGEILTRFAWTVIFVSTMGVGVSFTPVRKLEGAGASKIGTLFLYLVIARVGAEAEFSEVLDAPALLLVAALWIALHAAVMLVLRRLLRAPVFYMAVGSQANIGGAASAPLVAAAYHPALAPVGVLLGIAGYVLGTGAGLTCAFLLRWVHQWY